MLMSTGRSAEYVGELVLSSKGVDSWVLMNKNASKALYSFFLEHGSRSSSEGSEHHVLDVKRSLRGRW